MKLWLLRPVEGLGKRGNPWEPWFDKCFGFVIRAETEDQARAVADEEAGCENDDAGKKHPWKEPRYSTCVELVPEGEAGEIIRDFSRA